jgi:hypothetical protein
MRRRSVHFAVLLSCLLAVTALVGVAQAHALSFERHDYGVTGPTPNGMGLGDLNGDGSVDVVVNDGGTTATASFLYNAGDGSLAAPQPFSTNALSTRIAMADFNGDGRLDWTIGGMRTYMFNGAAGAFFSLGSWDPGTTPADVAAADFNGDHLLDEAVTLNGEAHVAVLQGWGTGAFHLPAVKYTTAGYPNRLVAADFNEDGAMDLAAACYGGAVSVLLGNGDGTFAPSINVPAANAVAVAALDLDGDGHLDLAVTDHNAGLVRLFVGDGTGAFAPAPVAQLDTAATPLDIAAGDLDGDGIADLVVLCSDGDRVHVFPSNGDGTFLPRLDLTTPDYPLNLGLADMDGDGDTDIVTANNQADSVSVFINDGHFSPAGTMTLDNGMDCTTLDSVTIGSSVSGATQMRVREAGGTWGEWQTYAAQLPWQFGDAADGLKTVEVDYRGHGILALTLSDSIMLDATRPVTTDDAPAGWLAAADLPFDLHLTASDGAGSGVVKTQYAVDGAFDWTGEGSLVTLSADGVHQVNYRSVDAAGNEETTKTCLVRIDTQAPVTTDDAPAGWVGAAGLPLYVHIFAAPDAGSPVTRQYKLDGAAAWTDGSVIPVEGDGVHQIQYRAVDEAGNAEQTNTCTVRVDATAPVTTDDSPTTWVGASALPLTVHLSAAPDAGGPAATQYKVDGAASWTDGAAVSLSANGVHVIEYRSTDAVGNVEATKTCTVRIDTAAPVTTDDSPDTWVGAAKLPLVVHLTAVADAGSPIATQYKVDGAAAWTDGSSVTLSANGLHTVDYRSVDGAGNVEATKTCLVAIDTIKPVTSGLAVTATRGRKATFKVKVADKVADKVAGDPAQTIVIKIRNAKGKVVATLSGFGPMKPNVTLALAWKKCTLARGTYKYLVYATDAARNKQSKAGGNKLVVK